MYRKTGVWFMNEPAEHPVMHEWIKEASLRDRIVLEAVVHLLERALEGEDEHHG